MARSSLQTVAILCPSWESQVPGCLPEVSFHNCVLHGRWLLDQRGEKAGTYGQGQMCLAEHLARQCLPEATSREVQASQKKLQIKVDAGKV